MYSVLAFTIACLSLLHATTAAPLYNKPVSIPNATPITPRTVALAESVVGSNFPDPTFIELFDGVYAFSTSSGGKYVQMAKSPSFDHPSWQILNVEPLPNPGAWTDGSKNIWAPYIVLAGNGNYVLYYSAVTAHSNGQHCIGYAVSKSVLGPFIPSSAPFACPAAQGGAIDPTVITDPRTGSMYVVYKVDGNSLDGDGTAHPTPIMLQQINGWDAATPIGQPVTILDHYDPKADNSPLVEAPAIYITGGVYYLIFSANYYNTNAYDLRYATASAISGPYTMVDQPLMATGDGHGVVAPGSADIHSGKLMFHGTVSSSPSLVRDMFVGHIEAQGGRLTFTGMA